jgi:hypothetical protein
VLLEESRIAGQMVQISNRNFKQGYHVSHVGMLCWSPLTSAGIVPELRTSSWLSLQSSFMPVHLLLQTSTSTSRSFGHAIMWNGILSALIYFYYLFRSGLLISAAELELTAAIFKAIAKDTNNIKNHRFRAEDLAGYHSEITKQKIAWSAKKYRRSSQHRRQS